MSELMLHQIDNIRHAIGSFIIVPSRDDPELDYSILPNNINLLIFGPSGSGKSSLIRSFYRSLHNCAQLPPEIQEKLTIKGRSHNEGTTHFSTVKLKDEHFGGRYTSGVIVYDTRGQIWMDPKELAQAELVIEGKVRDMSVVEQRNFRYAYLLWEFWKDSNHLFPTDIVNRRPDLADKPHALMLVFDGSMEELPSGAEETIFYRDIIQAMRTRGFQEPLIVLTHIDEVQQGDILDLKVDQLALRLGVTRSSIHLVENYREARWDSHLNIDFNVLKLLHEAMQIGEGYLKTQLKAKRSCTIQ